MLIDVLVHVLVLDHEPPAAPARRTPSKSRG
jgi:hypothetical protein